MAQIEPHKVLCMIATLVTIIVLIVRRLSRSKGNDFGLSMPYLVIVIVGTACLFLLGGTGGDLVYEYGIGVSGGNPLLP